MSRGTLLGLLAVVLALAGSAIAQQGSPYGAEYHTCRTPDNTLTYIGQDASVPCPGGQPRVILRGRGIHGPTGPAGVAGTNGRNGTSCVVRDPASGEFRLTSPFCRGVSGGGLIDRTGFIASSGASRRHGMVRTLADGDSGVAEVSCAKDELLLGGGHTFSDVDSGTSWKMLAVFAEKGNSTTWEVRATNGAPEKVKLTAWAVCTKSEGPDVVVPRGSGDTG